MAEGHLLVDIGNSAIKYCLESDLHEEKVSVLHHGEGDFLKVIELLLDSSSLSAVSLASVYRREFTEQIKCCCDERQVEFHEAKTQSQSAGLKNGYTVAQQLGVDRWLGMIAASEESQGAFFVVSCGTAVTFDAVDNTGQHLGGAIMPGLALMQHSLSEKTIALEVESDLIASGLVMGRNTDMAIATGTMAAITGFITTMTKMTDMEMKQGILTGGYASLVSQTMGGDIRVSPSLVLKGLAVSSRRASQK